MKENGSASFPEGESFAGPTLTIPQTRNGIPARLVTLFGSLGSRGEKRAHYIFDVGQPAYSEIVLPADGPVRSISLQAPAAAWHERELHDQYGIEILGHPDPRPLIF